MEKRIRNRGVCDARLKTGKREAVIAPGILMRHCEMFLAAPSISSVTRCMLALFMPSGCLALVALALGVQMSVRAAGFSDFTVYATEAGCGAITMSGNVSTDSFDSRLGPYTQTKQPVKGSVGATGNVELNGDVTVNGFIFGLNITTGQCQNGQPGISLSGKARATGGYLQLSSAPAFPNPPSVTPGSQAFHFNSDGALPPGSYGDITVTGGHTLTFSPGTYNVNSLTLSGGDAVIVSPGGQVFVNVAGQNVLKPIDINGGAVINPSGVALNFQLIYGGAGEVSFSGPTCNAVLYAPNARVTLTGSSNWFGAMVVGTLNASGAIRLHYDRSLTVPAVTLPGIYRDGSWFEVLNLSLPSPPSTGRTATFGGTGDQPVTGDWNGSGTTKIGIFKASSGQWELDYNDNSSFDGPVVDRVYSFPSGSRGIFPLIGDIGVTGDWTGTGITKIGIYRPSTGQWFLDTNGNGILDSDDRIVTYGGNVAAEEVPATGDWTGSGTTKIGIYRSTTGQWFLDTNGNGMMDAGDLITPFGGIAGDQPVTGDWNGSGTSKIGIFRQGFFWILDYDGNYVFDPGDKFFPFGGHSSDRPVTGNWRRP
jgi:hypothetical protein